MLRKSVLIVSFAASVIACVAVYGLSRPAVQSDRASRFENPKNAQVDNDRAADNATVERPLATNSGQKQIVNDATKSLDAALSHSETTSEQSNAENRGYEVYETQIDRDLSPPRWFYYDRNVYAEVAVIDSTAAIMGVACGESVCRVEVRHQSGEARERFAEAHAGNIGMSASSPEPDFDLQKLPANIGNPFPTNVSTAYFYPSDDTSLTVLYVSKTDSQEEVLKKLQAKVGR